MGTALLTLLLHWGRGEGWQIVERDGNEACVLSYHKEWRFLSFTGLDRCLLVRLHTGIWHFLNQLNIKVSTASWSGCLAITTGRKNQKQTKNEYLKLDFVFNFRIVKMLWIWVVKGKFWYFSTCTLFSHHYYITNGDNIFLELELSEIPSVGKL